MADKAVVRKADMLPAPMLALVQSLVPDCGDLLPPDITSEQFRAALWLELTGRPELNDSPLEDIRLCIVKAAQYGLLPGRDVHFLPFRNKQKGNRKCATYVPNYQGLLRSLYRTGAVDQAFAEVVYTNDVFDLDLGRAQVLIHKPARKHRGKPDGAYGYILVKGSTRPLVHYMDPDDLARVERKAPAHDQGPWVSDPGEMWRKTAMKNVMKYAPLTPVMQQLLADDEARELEDIPVERQLKNVTDLFDNGAGASTQGNRTVIVDAETGEVHGPTQETAATPKETRTAGDAPVKMWETPEGKEDPSRAKNTGSQATGWRRTIERHLIDSDVLTTFLPPQLLQNCRTAFAIKNITEDDGEALAAQLLEWVAEYEARQP